MIRAFWWGNLRACAPSFPVASHPSLPTISTFWVQGSDPLPLLPPFPLPQTLLQKGVQALGNYVFHHEAGHANSAEISLCVVLHQLNSWEMLSATIRSQRNVLRPLTVVSSAQLDTRWRRLLLMSPYQHPYTSCNPSASYSSGIVRILCAVVVVASSPTSNRQLAVFPRHESMGRQSHAQPTRLRFADLGPLGQTTITELSTLAYLDPSPTCPRRFRQAQWTDLSTVFAAAVRPPLAAETASLCPLVNRTLTTVIKTFSLSSSWCFVVKSLTLLQVPTSQPGAVLAVIQCGCAYRRSPCCP